jgi:cytochrome bd-type quinol oxidase subunit 2
LLWLQALLQQLLLLLAVVLLLLVVRVFVVHWRSQAHAVASQGVQHAGFGFGAATRVLFNMLC